MKPYGGQHTRGWRTRDNNWRRKTHREGHAAEVRAAKRQERKSGEAAIQAELDEAKSDEPGESPGGETT